MVSEISQKITSAEKQNEDANVNRIARKLKRTYLGQVVFNFFLSSEGFKALKLANLRPKEFRFQDGMKNPFVIEEHNDPVEKDWKPNYQKKLHAMILLAHNCERDLEQECNGIEKSLLEQNAGKILFPEIGRRLYDGDCETRIAIEHFGYRDGINQPRFFFKRKSANRLLENKWKIALDDIGGSFLVFRKLRQDVKTFNLEITRLAKHLNISEEFAKAQVMGRFPDGTPLILFEDPTEVKSLEDMKKVLKFDSFDEDRPTLGSHDFLDKNGLKCPFHAHIRKVNPRDQHLNDKDYRGKKFITRIVRRGIPYSDSEKEKGLLFMCFQRNITQQFSRIQKEWSNLITFPEDNSGLDLIIGQTKGEDSNYRKNQNWITKWGKEKAKEPFSFKKVVHFEGGEFFYAAPISFLKNFKLLL